MKKKKSGISKTSAAKKKKVYPIRSKHVKPVKPVKPISHKGDERKAHEQIISRRVTGGVAMSREEIAEAYIHAQEQWLQLPGSIIRSPTDVFLIQNRLKIKDTSTSLKHSDKGTDEGDELP